MKAIWTVSGQQLKAEQLREWHVEIKELFPRHIRRNDMNRQDEIAFTHFTEIAEANRTEVRRLQAEVVLSILRAIGATLGRVFKRRPHHENMPVTDHS